MDSGKGPTRQQQLSAATADYIYSFVSYSTEETHQIARSIAEHISAGAIVSLSGALGAGKTEFVRGFASAWGVESQVSSPTFVLEAVYRSEGSGSGSQALSGKQAGISLHHWDLYRLTTGIEEGEVLSAAGDRDRITLIEWPERAEWAKSDIVTVRIVLEALEPDGVPGKELERVRGVNAQQNVTTSDASFVKSPEDSGVRRIQIVASGDQQLSNYLLSISK